MTASKSDTKWRPGQSGNPRGKKPGTGRIARLRDAIGEELPDILTILIKQAKEGDTQAAKILLEKVLPPMRPTETLVEISLPPDTSLSGKAEAILQAVAAGTLAPGQGAQMLSGLGNVARLREVDELTKRIEALEADHDRRS